MEINEDQMGAGKSYYLFRASYSNGARYHHLHFGRDSESSKGVGKLCSGKKERLLCALIGGCWQGESCWLADWKQGSLCLVKVQYLAFSWSQAGKRDKN